MILEGTTSSGAVVPVQVTDQGRVVAEGLPGAQGPAGPQGPEGPPGPAGGYWERTGTVVSPTNAGDTIATDDNAVQLVPGTTGSPLVRDSLGRLLVGSGILLEPDGRITQTASFSGPGQAQYIDMPSPLAGQYFVHYGSSGSKFTVDTVGTIRAVNTTISPISSERRLKENVVPVDDVTAWDTIKSVPYYCYSFIGDESGNRLYGPMADEVPDDMRVATDRSDEHGVIHSYDNAMLQARLYVALQTALKRIEDLEARITRP